MIDALLRSPQASGVGQGGGAAWISCQLEALIEETRRSSQDTAKTHKGHGLSIDKIMPCHTTTSSSTIEQAKHKRAKRFFLRGNEEDDAP